MKRECDREIAAVFWEADRRYVTRSVKEEEENVGKQKKQKPKQKQKHKQKQKKTEKSWQNDCAVGVNATGSMADPIFQPQKRERESKRGRG